MGLIFKVKIMLNIQEIREQFPILNQKVNDKPLVYLDNAASSQKPLMVIKKWEEYYQTINANVHRGIHTLSQLATEEMELSRQKIQKFINAKYSQEIIFTRGTTESILLHHSTDKSRRRNHYFSSGTPLKHRSLADALRENRRRFEGYPNG